MANTSHAANQSPSRTPKLNQVTDSTTGSAPVAQRDAESAMPATPHTSIEAADEAGAHSIETHADAGQGGNVETDYAGRRGSVEAMAPERDGNIEQI